MKKFAGLFLALLALASPTAAITQAIDAEPTPFFIDMALVEFIDCGTASGSGSRIDSNTVLTAYHVVANRAACTVEGQPSKVVFFDASKDYAVLSTVSTSAFRMTIDCTGPKRGEHYTGLGYAFGERFVEQKYAGTGRVIHGGQFKGLTTFKGMSFPGMSGGPVVNADGHIIAMVNAGNAVGSMHGRSMADTYMCAGGNV